jgi:hypothetical protein
MSNQIKLPDFVEVLTEDEQRLLLRKLLGKFGLTSGDEKVYHVINTGYASRLVDKKKGNILSKKAIEELEDNEINPPIFIKDCLWGDGIYLVNEKFQVECLGNNMNVIKEKITPELFSVVSHAPDGSVCFHSDEDNDLISTLKNIDYCCIFGYSGVKYKVSADNMLISIESVDSESG